MALKILIVDDEQDVLKFQEKFLSRRGYRIFTAVNSSGAMESIRDNFPDIVFCDVRLESDTAGMEILSAAKKIRPGIIFYLVTGLIENGIDKKGMDLGAKAVLTKPLSNEDLENKIKEACL